MMTQDDLDRTGLASAVETTPEERWALNRAIAALEPYADSENLGGLLEQARARMPRDNDVSGELVKAHSEVRAERASLRKAANVGPLEKTRLDC
jgi:hypothetical protein